MPLPPASHRLLTRIMLCACLGVPFAAAKELVVQRDRAPVFAKCFEQGQELASLPAGHKVRLRFAIAGSDSRCYYVSTELDGNTLAGYVPKDALAGLEEFELGRREASRRQLVESAIETIGLPPAPAETSAGAANARQILPEVFQAIALLNAGQAMEAERLLAKSSLTPDNRDVALVRARALLQLTRPSEALEVIKPALRHHPKDAQLLAAAGMGSLQRDDIPAAMNYFRRSLAIEPNPAVQRLYEKVEREISGDQSQDTSYGSRFQLRYEGDALNPVAAQQLTHLLDREITRISYELGCSLTERLPVIVQTRDNYRKTTGAADWSGGHYDGRIRIVMPPSGEVDSQVQKVFAHEFTHACLARMGNWPLWLHEGLAQRLSGERLDSRSWAALRQMSHENRLPRLSALGNNWSRLDESAALVAYNLALAAIETFYRDFRTYGIRNLLNNPARLPAITTELEKRLPENLP